MSKMTRGWVEVEEVIEGINGDGKNNTRLSRTFQTRPPSSKLAIWATEQLWRGLERVLQGDSWLLT